MGKMKYPNRVNGEIELLSTHFGDVQFDPDDPSSVVIERFDLPLGFNRKYAALLIDLGPEYPIYPPQDFYLSPGLRKNGKKPGFYYEDGYMGKKYRKLGYAWLCLHIIRWRPNSYSMIKGDNLLIAAQVVYEALGRS